MAESEEVFYLCDIEKDEGNVSTSRFGSKVRDMVTQCKATVRGDVWRATVVKATSRSCEAPDSKSLKTLLGGIKYYGCDVISSHSAPRIILETFIQRLAEPDWIVVFKALTSLHYLLRDTVSESFAELANKRKAELFDIKFRERNPKTFQFAPLIETYANYLLAYCTTRERTRYPPLKNDLLDAYANYEKMFYRRFESMEGAELLTTTPELIATTSVLLRVSFSLMERKVITSLATKMLSRDLSHFVSSEHTAVLALQQKLEREPATLDADACKEVFRKHDLLCKEAKIEMKTIEFCERSGWRAPEFHTMKQLESNIETSEVINSIGACYL